jgi:GNAT superfamily N-acetyltransferase
MNAFTIEKNLKDNEELRKSFNALAFKVFGISFEDWYKKGYWKDRYKPFSLIAGNKVIANVSVYELDLVIDGVTKRAVQIGSVMTDPDYRNKGLSRILMNEVVTEYENKYDVMYLYANHSVLDFYPKFGFHSIQEYQYSMEINKVKNDSKTDIRKLDGNSEEDLNFIYQFASERWPISNLFATKNTQDLLMFYCLYVFTNNLYYLEEVDVIVIYKIEGNQLHIFDSLCKEKVQFENIIKQIATENTKQLVLHYTPDYEGFQFQKEPFHDDTVLYVKINGDTLLPNHFKHPITSQA